MYGGGGDDQLYASEDDGAKDLVYGGAGHDELWAGSGGDELYGEAGNDTLNAGSGGIRCWTAELATMCTTAALANRP
ncbi:hypothetical protein [Desulfobulbus oralis]|uniref:hypothetical protein n=1 Tax=Desulfobulbus oralis TaxID=1986146 RepID=UPI0011B05253